EGTPCTAVLRRSRWGRASCGPRLRQWWPWRSCRAGSGNWARVSGVMRDNGVQGSRCYSTPLPLYPRFSLRGDPQDHATFPAGPSTGRIGKCQAEERGLRSIWLLDPAKSSVGGTKDRAALPDDPACFRVSKTDLDEVGWPGTRPGTGQRSIDPTRPAIHRLKQGAGISNHPSVERIGT